MLRRRGSRARALAGAPRRPLPRRREFVRRLSARAGPVADISREQWQPCQRPLAELFAAEGEEALAHAYRQDGYRLREIAEYLGLHPATVSRRLRRSESSAPEA